MQIERDIERLRALVNKWFIETDQKTFGEYWKRGWAPHIKLGCDRRLEVIWKHDPDANKDHQSPLTKDTK